MKGCADKKGERGRRGPEREREWRGEKGESGRWQRRWRKRICSKESSERCFKCVLYSRPKDESNFPPPPFRHPSLAMLSSFLRWLRFPHPLSFFSIQNPQVVIIKESTNKNEKKTKPVAQILQLKNPLHYHTPVEHKRETRLICNWLP